MKSELTLQELKDLHEQVIDAKAAVHKLEQSVSEMIEKMGAAPEAAPEEVTPVMRSCATCKYRYASGHKDPCSSCCQWSQKMNPHPRWEPAEKGGGL